jgi:hypothetical protein
VRLLSGSSSLFQLVPLIFRNNPDLFITLVRSLGRVQGWHDRAAKDALNFLSSGTLFMIDALSRYP